MPTPDKSTASADKTSPDAYVLVGQEIESNTYKPNQKIVYVDYKTTLHLDTANLEKTIKLVPDVPTNIILNCHGITTDHPDGAGKHNYTPKDSFWWHDDDRPSYSEFFGALKALPNSQNIRTLFIDNCFGGIAENEKVIAQAPAGTVVLTAVSSTNESWELTLAEFAREAKIGGSPADLMLASLHVLDPSGAGVMMKVHNDKDVNPFTYIAAYHWNRG